MTTAGPFADWQETAPTPAPEPVPLRIEGTWLVEVHDDCTIGCEPTYGHQPGCGLLPLVDLSTLDGWPAPRTVTAAATTRILELHQDEGGWCTTCHDYEQHDSVCYPCPTIRALTEPT